MNDDRHPDDFETRFWLGTVAAGAWVTVLMCSVSAFYLVFFVEAGNRLGVGASLVAATIGGAVALLAVPWRRVIASRWREHAFFAWTVSTIAVISASAAFDGGAGSPLALMLFLPAVFASLAFPLRLVVAAAVLAELAFLALILVGAPTLGYVVAFCAALAGTSIMAVWQASYHDAWRFELDRRSSTDPLTDLLNRRGFAMASDAAFSGLARQGRPVTLLVIDLDLFKAFNDAHGHQAGDALLQWVAAQLGSSVRPTDAVARLGGDEFAVLLPDTGRPESEPVIRRVEAALSDRASHCLGRASAPEQGTTFDELYRAADSHMYQRKLQRMTALQDAAAAQT